MASNIDTKQMDEERAVQNVEPPELFKMSKATDLTILVGGKSLHFAKFPLTQGSDVFTQLIENSLDQSRLELHDVAYKDMLMFLECLHPKTFESITDTNLEPVVSVAYRFKHDGILKRCEEYLLQQFSFQGNPPDGMYPNYFFHLKVAEKYGLKSVVDAEVASRRVKKSYFSQQKGIGEFHSDLGYKQLKGYVDDYNFQHLSFETKFCILSTRLKIAEAVISREDPYLEKKPSLF